jgi:hypothetical protein
VSRFTDKVAVITVPAAASGAASAARLATDRGRVLDLAAPQQVALS